MTIDPDKYSDRVFLVRMLGKLDEARASNTLLLGWSKAEGLDKVTEWETLKRRLAEAYQEIRWTERALGNMASSLNQFLHKMQVGDLAVVPVSGGFFPVRITSAPYYDQTKIDLDTSWRRNGEWLSKQPIPRSYASYPLQKRMKAQQTVLDISDLRTDVFSAINLDEPITIAEEVSMALSAPLLKTIRNYVTDRGLEQLVANLVRSTGATANVAARTDRRAGDVDVVATHDLRIGNEESVVKVAYQVKHHEGVTDESGVRQLVDRMKEETFVRGCLVTLGTEVTPAALKLAEENDILILTETELVAWILDVGFSAFETKAN
jgi:predicted Mrr-cat superfamily restriction endonuclease